MENLRISDTSESLAIFPRFMELPKELRDQIWRMSIRPRLVPYNAISARRSRLKFDSPIQPLLHVCHESRTEALKTYHVLKGTHYLAVRPQDTVLWIRYNGPRTLRVDAQRLARSDAMDYIEHLAVSIKFWNSISTCHLHKSVYHKIRMSKSLKVLTLIDDAYGVIKWGEMKGMAINLEEDAPSITAQEWHQYPTIDPTTFVGGWSDKSKDALWKEWDAWKGFDAAGGVASPKGEVPEVRWAKVRLLSFER